MLIDFDVYQRSKAFEFKPLNHKNDLLSPTPNINF